MTAPCPDDDELTEFVERRLPEPRRAEIEAHCEACDACRDAVSLLVEAFAPPPSTSTSGGTMRPGRGTTLGRYVILDFIGAGGMGSVYEAFDPELDRRVALKMLPPGSDDDSLRARFLAEARAMASVSHPNVIAVHDVGTHRDIAFFAMELVEGETLARWLAATRRDTKDIVAVFAAAGRGLAAAHAGGLVHRDFKPGNVLVGRDGRVRVIDFGLARFAGETTQPRPAEIDAPQWELPQTRTGSVVGTPAYMAPEQLTGTEADARADQFAFCVSLYEALLDRRPFEGSSPEARLASIAAGPPRPGPGRRGVSGRLQRLVGRGLAAKPSDRYPSMDALVDELTARPWARWWPMAAGLIAAVGIGVGVRGAVADGVGPHCDRDADRLAGVWDAERRQALVAGATGDAAADSAPARTVTWLADRFDAYAARWVELDHEVCVAAIERRDRTPAMIDRQRICLSDARTRLRAHVDVAQAQGPKLVEQAVAFADSLPSLQTCADPARLVGGPPPPDPDQREAVEAQRATLADAYSQWASGDFRRVIEIAHTVESAARQTEYAPLEYEAALLRGGAAGRIVDKEQAESALRAALEGALSIDDHPLAIEAAATLACLASTELGDPTAGIAYGRTAIGIARRPETLPTDRAHALRCLGRALKQAGRFEEAEGQLREAIEVLDEVGESADVSRAKALAELGQILVRRRRFADAVPELERAAEIFADTLGPDSPDAVSVEAEVAAALVEQGEPALAERRYRRVVEVWSRASGPRSSQVGMVHAKLGNLLYGENRHEEAQQEFAAAEEILIEALGPEHPNVLAVQASLANVLMQLHRLDEARRLYHDTRRKLERVLSPSHPMVVQLRSAVAQVELQQLDHAAAISSLQPAAEVCASGRDVPDDVCGDVALGLARARLLAGDRRAARAALAEAKARYEGAPSPMPPDIREVIDELEAEL